MENNLENALLEKIDGKLKSAIADYQKENTTVVEFAKNVKFLEAKFTELEKSLPVKVKLSETKEFLDLQKAFDVLAVELQSVKETYHKSNPQKEYLELKSAIEKRAAVLKNSYEAPALLKQADVLALGTSISGGYMPQSDRDSVVADFNKRVFTIRNLASVGVTTSNTVEFISKVEKKGTVTTLGENLPKPQISYEYLIGKAYVVKIPAMMKITKEMLDDVDGIMFELQNELYYEISLAEELQLMFGDGTGSNLNGIAKYAKQLTELALAGTVPAGKANRFDAIAAAVKQINIQSEGRAKASAIIANPADAFTMIHGTRETTNGYIVGNTPFISFENGISRIYGLPVIETNSIPAGSFMVCDMQKLNIKDRERLNISMGYDDGDFRDNRVSFIAENRLVSYVKTNHEVGFVYDSFVDAINFIEASS